MRFLFSSLLFFNSSRNFSSHVGYADCNFGFSVESMRCILCASIIMYVALRVYSIHTIEKRVFGPNTKKKKKKKKELQIKCIGSVDGL